MGLRSPLRKVKRLRDRRRRQRRPVLDAWSGALDDEVGFWARWLETGGDQWPEAFAERFDPDLALQPELAALVAAPPGPGAVVRILDVGAGPLTYVGRKLPGYEIEITAVDALAEEYAKLLDDADVAAPVRTQQCETEHLSEHFPADHFDIGFARNTLDHSYDPVRAIGEMLHCVKPGAPVLLMHHRNVATDEDYHGMHQWNLDAGADGFVVWRPGSRTDVVAALGGVATLESVDEHDGFQYVVLRKTGTAPRGA